MNNKRKILSWLLVIMWMLVIVVMSNQPAHISDSQSLGFISKLESVNINITHIFGSYTNFIVRKCAHFIEYIILGILINNALGFDFKNKKLFYLSVIFSVIYASTDEIHQSFVPGRECALRDVVIDSCGSIFGILGKNILNK